MSVDNSHAKEAAIKKKILVVDDDPEDRRKIVTAMEKEGYAVLETGNVDEAMEKVRKTSPDLVIIDVVTEDSNTTGYDICDKIKAAFQPSPPLLLMVTGNASGVNNGLADKMGAAGLEVKTSDMRYVTQKVRDIFSRSTP